MKPSDAAKQFHGKIDWIGLRDLREIKSLDERMVEVLKGVRLAGVDDFISPAILQQIAFIQAGKKYASTPYRINNALQEYDGALENRFNQSRKFRFPDFLPKPGIVPINGELHQPDKLLINICERFHRAIAHLTHRRKGRPVISFKDEYDVQDVFGTVVKCSYQDVQDEVWTPSYAGKSARIDFVIEDIKTATELKRARSK